MKRLPVTISTTAKALTEPQPEFVSMVVAGANQTGFRAVKQDVLPVSKEDLAVTDAISAARAEGHEIARIVFKGDEFATKSKVTKWLTDGGYTEFEVAEKGDNFEVINDSVEFEDGSVSKIKIDEDDARLDVFVGKIKVEKEEVDASEEKTEKAKDSGSVVKPVAVIKEDADAEGNKDEAQKADESTETMASPEMKQKFDDFMAMFSEGKTLTDVLRDSNDGFPAGMQEAALAMFTAMRNNIVAGDFGRVKGVAVEFGDLVFGLAKIFEGSEQTDRQKMIDLFAPEIVLAAPAQGEEDAASAAEETPVEAAPQDATDAPGETAAAEEPAQKVEDAPKGETTEKQEAHEDPVIAALVTSVAGITEAVKGLVAGITEVKSEVEDTKAGLEEVGASSQSQKSVDADEALDGDTAQKDEVSPLAGYAFKSALGISANSPKGGRARKA